MSISNENIHKRKKGVKNSQNYEFNVVKLARVKGSEYTSPSGKVVKERVTGDPCNCVNKCFLNISQDNQVKLLFKLSEFNTKNEQDIFLSSLIETNRVRRCRPREASLTNKPKSATYSYYVTIDTKKFKVCQKAFISLFGITQKRLRRLQSIILKGGIPHDMRGIGNKNRAFPEQILKEIHDHISLFPVQESHYASRDYRFLDSNLNVKIMYNLFKKSYPTSKVSYKYYNEYFKKNFDLSFGRPQVDTCITCEELLVKIKSPSINESAKRIASAEFIIHRRRAKKFFSMMKETQEICKHDDTVLGICFDFMQNLPIPKIPVQDVFYLRQLWLNIFCIHNCKTGNAMLYAYHEGIARKGANEVCTFILDYIKNNVPETVKHLRLFSDGAVGQNKNHSVIRLCRALVDTGRFETITQYFPIRGHSFNACDRHFGLIKRVLRKHDRIYSVLDYCSLVLNSSVKIQHFILKLVETDEILNFSKWWPRIYKKGGLSLRSQDKNIPRNEKVSFQPTMFMHYKYDSRQSGHVTAYRYINGLNGETFNLHIPTVIPHLNIEKAYSKPVPIAKKKIDDLLKLRSYIPEEHLTFYDEILSWETCDNLE